MDTTAEIQPGGDGIACRPDVDRSQTPAPPQTGVIERARDGAATEAAALRTLVDRIQIARRGSAELDRQVDEALRKSHGSSWDMPFGRWSCDLDHAMALLPQSYNFSLGRRDGVCWAWTQPNDRWEPNEFEARHDHPAGSGLVVAHTAALAVACAAVILRLRRLEAARLEAERSEPTAAMT